VYAFTFLLQFRVIQDEVDRLLDALDDFSDQEIMRCQTPLSMDASTCSQVEDELLKAKEKAKGMLAEIRGMASCEV